MLYILGMMGMVGRSVKIDDFFQADEVNYTSWEIADHWQCEIPGRKRRERFRELLLVI